LKEDGEIEGEMEDDGGKERYWLGWCRWEEREADRVWRLGLGAVAEGGGFVAWGAKGRSKNGEVGEEELKRGVVGVEAWPILLLGKFEAVRGKNPSGAMTGECAPPSSASCTNLSFSTLSALASLSLLVGLVSLEAAGLMARLFAALPVGVATRLPNLSIILLPTALLLSSPPPLIVWLRPILGLAAAASGCRSSCFTSSLGCSSPFFPNFSLESSWIAFALTLPTWLTLARSRAGDAGMTTRGWDEVTEDEGDWTGIPVSFDMANMRAASELDRCRRCRVWMDWREGRAKRCCWAGGA
jgi:hypothetical protein